MRSESEQALLDAYKSARVPASEHIESTLQSVLARAEMAPATPPAATGTANVALKTIAGVVIGSAAITAVVVGTQDREPAPTAARANPAPVVEIQPAEPAPTAPPVATPTPAPEQEPTPAEAKPTEPRKRRAATRAPAVDPATAELRLLTKARRALRRGDHAAALELLERHAREFPSGSLTHERNASRIKALCALGRHDRAAKLGRAFAASSPNSAIAQQWREGCPKG